MNKLGCLIGMFFTYGVCSGQNLVPNWSFEDTVACPTGFTQIDKALGWSSYRQTPEYFNSCAGNNFIGVPVNYMGSQNALNGNAYAGFANRAGGGNLREFIGAQLTQTLTIGVKYYASFYVSRAANSLFYLTVAINKIGMKFSTVPYSNLNPQPMDNYAQIFTDSIIEDSLNWVKVSGSFIADSAYQYLSVGNFFNDSLTSYISYDTIFGYAYYYLDCICVSTDSLTCNSTVGINEVNNTEDFILFPNPFAEKLNITAKRNELIEVNLFDVTGRKSFNQSFIKSTSINTEQLAKGIYLYEVRNKNGVIKNGKIVKD